LQKFEAQIDHSIEYYRKNGLLTGDRIRDKTYHAFGKKGGFNFAAKRDESLFDFWLFNGRFFAIEAKQTAGVGIFLVNFKSLRKRGKEAWNVTYALNITDFIDYRENNDRSSVEFNYFYEHGYKIEKVRVGFTKPKKKDVKPRPKVGWDLVSLRWMK